MADTNSSSVSIVAIIAILIMVGLAIYFVLMRGSDDAELKIDVDGSSLVIPAPGPSVLA